MSTIQPPLWLMQINRINLIQLKTFQVKRRSDKKCNILHIGQYVQCVRLYQKYNKIQYTEFFIASKTLTRTSSKLYFRFSDLPTTPMAQPTISWENTGMKQHTGCGTTVPMSPVHSTRQDRSWKSAQKLLNLLLRSSARSMILQP